MMSKCRVCNGTGLLTSELKSKVTFRGEEIVLLQSALISAIEDSERVGTNSAEFEKLHDRLLKPEREVISNKPVKA